MSDLWPDEFGDSKIIPPLAILKEQAAAITAKTKQKIVGEVEQVPAHGVAYDFIYDFNLNAPFLDDYSYTLFRASHSVQLYPVFVAPSTPSKATTKCEDSNALTEALKQIFASEETKRIINSLLAQTSAAMAGS